MKKIARRLTHTRALRYWSGMTSLKVWGSALVVVMSTASAVGCGETSNFVGNMPDDGGSGGTSSGAGTNGGGSGNKGGSTSQAGTGTTAGTTSTAGTGNGGTSQGGTGQGGTGQGGSTSTAGTGMGGGTTGDCTQLSGNWTICKDGPVHRTAPGKCDSKLPHAGSIPAVDPQLDECTSDSQCTAKPNGFCSVLYPGFSDVKAHNSCSYGCTQDSDCGENQACQCGSEIGECTTSIQCKSDKDCQGGLCAQFDACPGVPTYDFQCQNPADECASDADCRAKDANKQFCAIGQSGHRECVGVECAI